MSIDVTQGVLDFWMNPVLKQLLAHPGLQA
jgi:hypothetical protein